jgi:isopenicillin-N epimerase
MTTTSDPNDPSLETPAVSPELWTLDPAVTFLNHGSFGSCPRAVLEFQNQLRQRLERQPVRFFVRDLEALWDDARAQLAAFVGAQAEDLVFVPNATAGINTVLRSLCFAPGDELLVTDHEYNACRNALDYVASRAGARVVVATIPFPLRQPDDVIAAIVAQVTDRTRLLLVDHVTSQTGMVMPVQAIVRALAQQGVDVLIDGAHGPGMVPVDLEAIGAAYYTGNTHKWLCGPKSAALLHVRRDRQDRIRPLVISHGANSQRTDRSRFLIEFGWMGTGDPTPALSVPAALRIMNALLPGGWPHVMQRNRALALAGRKILADALGVELPCPDSMIGSLAALRLPDAVVSEPSKSPLYLDPLQDYLLEKHGIELPIIPWPNPPKRLIRISAQLYNSLPEYRRLGDAIRAPGLLSAR